MKKTFFIASLIFQTIIGNAQTDTSNVAQTDTSWIKGGFAALAFNQSSFSQWAAGGENAISLTTTVNLFANYKKEKTAWDNSLDMAYGMIKYGGEDLRKNEDKFELNSKYGYLIYRKSTYLSGLINMKSQFTRGYVYAKDGSVTAVSDFLAPGYLTTALGIDYKPNNFFSLFISPATGKFTFVMDQTLANAGMYGVTPAIISFDGRIIRPGERFRPEFGAFLRARFQKDLLPNLNLMSTLVLFNNYTDKQKDNRKNIDIDWQTMVNIKAGKLITASLFTHIIYDQDISAKTQFKQLLGIGISYKL